MFKDEMTPKERNKAYFKGDEVDRLPCSLSLGETATSFFNINQREYYFSPEIMAGVEIEVDKMFGQDNSGAKIGLLGMGEAIGSEIGYSDDNLAYLKKPILSGYDMLDSLKVPNPYSDGRLPLVLKTLEILQKELGDKKNIGLNMGGPLSVASTIRGTKEIMKDLRKNKENLHKLLMFSTECNLEFVKVLYNDFGIVPSIAEPLASLNLISPKMFEEFPKVYLKMQVDGIKKITGKSPSLHICGKTKSIWPIIKEIGFSGFSVDNCEDLEELKNEIGDSLCISGNVDPVDIIKSGTIEDVERETLKCLVKGMDSKKGFILSPGCQIPKDTLKENLEVIMNTVRKYTRNASIGKSVNLLIAKNEKM